MPDRPVANTPPTETIIRLTAMWALSEAGLAGVLHAFRIPFTGMIIGTVAVLFITLLFSFNPQKGTILKATLLVMILKALVSPHTPVNAYFAVAFQGGMGELLFLILKRPAIVAPLLALIAMIEASLQKLLVLTLVFGQTLWESINIFTGFVIRELSIPNWFPEEINYSFLFVGIYVGIHLIAGIFAAFWIPLLVMRVHQKAQKSQLLDVSNLFEDVKPDLSKRKRRWLKKISLYALFSLAILIFIGSYLFPFFEKSQGIAAVTMLIRSIIIMSSWYFIIGPAAMRWLRKYFKKKQNFYSSEIEHMLQLFPLLKKIIRYSWAEASVLRGTKRLMLFSENLLVHLLVVRFPNEDQWESSEPLK